MEFRCLECSSTDVERVMSNGGTQKIKLKDDGTYRVVGATKNILAEVLRFRCISCGFSSDDPADFIPGEFVEQYKQLFQARQEAVLVRARGGA